MRMYGYDRYGDPAEMQRLIANSERATRDLNIALGVKMTKEQMDAIQDDMISVEIIERDGKIIPVPKLNIAKKNRNGQITGAHARDGIYLEDKSLVAGGNMSAPFIQLVSTEGPVSIYGNIEGGILYVDSASNTLFQAKTKVDELVSIAKGDHIVDVFADLNAKKIHLSAGRDNLINEGSVNAEEYLGLYAKRDIINKGGSLSSGGDATLVSERDIIHETEVTRHGAGNIYQDVLGKKGTTNVKVHLSMNSAQDTSILGFSWERDEFSRFAL